MFRLRPCANGHVRFGWTHENKGSDADDISTALLRPPTECQVEGTSKAALHQTSDGVIASAYLLGNFSWKLKAEPMQSIM